MRAGFQEVERPELEMTQAEYRNGNEKVNHVRKVNGMYKVGDVTLKRGLIGALDLTSGSTRPARATRTALRDITISCRTRPTRAR